MKQDCKIWNTLHDGVITNIDGSVPGDLRLTIEIEYLATRLKGSYKSISVLLSACKIFKYDFYVSSEKTITFSNLKKIVEQQPVNSICKCNSLSRNKGQAAIACVLFVPARMRGTNETLYTAYP